MNKIGGVKFVFLASFVSSNKLQVFVQFGGEGVQVEGRDKTHPFGGLKPTLTSRQFTPNYFTSFCFD
jgi:hypothetical protein